MGRRVESATGLEAVSTFFCPVLAQPAAVTAAATAMVRCKDRLMHVPRFE
jgi:hypothetical protein